MACFGTERFIEFAEEELRAAKLVLAIAATPLLFFLSTLSFLGKLNFMTKVVASISIASFAIAVIVWGLATVLSQLFLVAVRFERAKSSDEEILGAFVEKSWISHNNASAKLFKPAGVLIGLGFVSLSLFLFLVIWGQAK